MYGEDMKRNVRQAPLIPRTSLLAALFAVIAVTGGFAQSSPDRYPSQLIRIIVPFAAGGTADALARIVGDHLSQRWGSPVIVENKPGAQGNIGMALVAKSPPDGYTLALVPVGNASVNPSLFKDLPYDPIKDFTPISQLAVVENVLVVNGNSNIKTLDQLIELGKSKAANITYSTPGAGSQAHLAAELLAHATGINLTHIPYRGLAPALTDVLNGEITMTFAQLSNAKPFIENGRLRALGIASKERSAALPDVPTIAEAGKLPGFEAVSWYALMAPAHTPEAIVRKLSGEVASIMRLPDVATALEAQGAKPVGGSPEELAAVIAADTARWSKLIREAHIELQ
jgi:tripartite-type tricarboxylate transporter receptor subunit TctC